MLVSAKPLLPYRNRVGDENALAAICVALGACEVGGPLSPDEEVLARRSAIMRPDHALLDELRDAISVGEDPLGEAFSTIFKPEKRRRLGAFYTPPQIVTSMLAWALDRKPMRIVDPGCGSGRFAVAARRMGFSGEMIAVDSDPLATLMARAHLTAAGFSEATVMHGDFLYLRLPLRTGRTAFVGNPPYVRHHDLDPKIKRWAQEAGQRLGIRVSGLAGLHALFVLATAEMSCEGDIGCFITAAEWLDVGYGAALRELLAGQLGLVRIDVVDPKAATFNGAMTTAAITCWEVGYRGLVTIRRVDDPEDLRTLSGGQAVPRPELTDTHRWSNLLRPKMKREGLVPLGFFASVHRGVATGANDFFALPRDEAARHGLDQHVRPCLVRAAEVISAPGRVHADRVGHVLLDVRNSASDPALLAYLEEGERRGVPGRYLCSHRHPWWRVGGSRAPQIIATYMARQPPVFASNPDGCQILNVFHGIHFRERVSDEVIDALVRWLNAHRAELVGGRTYYGGLVKFEPRELESVLVPPLERLVAGDIE